MLQTLGVIFDMDGVLVDSYHAHFESWQIAGRRHGVTFSEPDFASTFGRTSREVIHQFWPGRFSDAEVAQFDADKEAAYREVLTRDFPAMPGVNELLTTLHAAGFRLAIGSSGPKENVALVRRLLPAGACFAATVDGSEVRHGKPDPEIFLTAAAKLGLPASACAVVEDALVGLQAARAAEMAAIALTGTFSREELMAHAAMVVNALSEITPSAAIALIAGNHPRQ